MSAEAQEPTPSDPIAPSENVAKPDEQSGESISYEELLSELTTMLSEKDQQIAQLRIIARRQATTVSQLQEELTKRGS